MVKQYLDLVKRVFVSPDSGFKEGSKGSGLISLFGEPQARYDLNEGFPLLTTKKMFTRSMFHETLWYLKGMTNIRYLEQNKCPVWRKDTFMRHLPNMVEEGIFSKKLLNNKYQDTWNSALKEYAQRIVEDEEFAERFGDAGPVYGLQLRHWPKFEDTGKEMMVEGKMQKVYVRDPDGIDQLDKVLGKMKKKPQGKKNIVSYWNVADLDDMSLEPCHSFFQMTSDEEGRFFMKMYQRSSDVFLGVPFNTSAYCLKGKIFAEELGLKPHAFFHTFGDFHLYTGLQKRTHWYRENIGELRKKMGKAIKEEEKFESKQGYLDTLEWINKKSPRDIDYPNDPEEEKYDHVTAAIEQLSREIRPLPTLKINNKNIDGTKKRYDELTIEDFVIENYNPHPPIRRGMLV